MILIKFNDLDLEQIQTLIKDGRIYEQSSGQQWFGNLEMFLNRFHSLNIESEDEENYEPIRADWHSKDADLQDKMEEIDEHIMLDNFDCGHGFFADSNFSINARTSVIRDLIRPDDIQ